VALVAAVAVEHLLGLVVLEIRQALTHLKEATAALLHQMVLMVAVAAVVELLLLVVMLLELIVLAALVVTVQPLFFQVHL
jgi:hypothetical protein